MDFNHSAGNNRKTLKAFYVVAGCGLSLMVGVALGTVLKPDGRVGSAIQISAAPIARSAAVAPQALELYMVRSEDQQRDLVSYLNDFDAFEVANGAAPLGLKRQAVVVSTADQQSWLAETCYEAAATGKTFRIVDLR